MAITSYPFDDQDTTEADYTRLFRELQDSGVADTIGGSGFQVTADASGMQVFVQPGFALVRGHAIFSTAVETVPISASAASLRIDRVVLRLDPTTNGITIAVVQGVAGAEAPSLTQTDVDTYELPLAKVNVDAGVVTIAGDKIVDDRRFLGHRVGAWTNDTRPAAPREARVGLNTTTGAWEYWDGLEWTPLAPEVTWSTIQGKPLTFPPDTHAHAFADLTGIPSSFTPSAHTHPWEQITGKPASFPTTDHEHSAGDITTGVIDVIHLPVGSGPADVAAGTHTHSWSGISSKPSTFPPTSHSHNQYLTSGETISWANGSRRVRDYNPSGSATWYSAWVDGNDRFCKNTSSIRYKENVRDYPIDPAAVLALRPVMYDRKDVVDEEAGEVSPSPKDELGLIAEEVNEHIPEIVQWEKGQIESLRYDLLPVALLSVVKDQEMRIKRLESAVELFLQERAQ